MAEQEMLGCRDCKRASFYILNSITLATCDFARRDRRSDEQHRCDYFKPKDEPDMVRCRDCKHAGLFEKVGVPWALCYHKTRTMSADFCADNRHECPFFEPKDEPDMSTDDLRTVLSTLWAHEPERRTCKVSSAITTIENHIAQLNDTLRRRQAHIDDIQGKLTWRKAVKHADDVHVCGLNDYIRELQAKLDERKAADAAKRAEDTGAKAAERLMGEESLLQRVYDLERWVGRGGREQAGMLAARLVALERNVDELEVRRQGTIPAGSPVSIRLGKLDSGLKRLEVGVVAAREAAPGMITAVEDLRQEMKSLTHRVWVLEAGNTRGTG